MLMKAQEEHAAKEAALKAKAAEEKAAVERRMKGEVDEKVSAYVCMCVWVCVAVRRRVC